MSNRVISGPLMPLCVPSAKVTEEMRWKRWTVLELASFPTRPNEQPPHERSIGQFCDWFRLDRSNSPRHLRTFAPTQSSQSTLMPIFENKLILHPKTCLRAHDVRQTSAVYYSSSNIFLLIVHDTSQIRGYWLRFPNIADEVESKPRNSDWSIFIE